MFAGDLPSQNRYALDGVAAILDGLGANPGDIVKFNTWRAPPPSPQAYRRAAQDRFDFLAAARPAATGITIPESTRPGPLIRMDAWAMRSTGGGALPRRTLKPAQHWDWPSPTPYSQGLRCGPWLFVGGQAALDKDGKVVGAGNRADQTELAMRYVAQVLGAAGACFDDVLKLNTYNCHGVGAGALQGGAEVRSRRFLAAGSSLERRARRRAGLSGDAGGDRGDRGDRPAARGRTTVSEASRLHAACVAPLRAGKRGRHDWLRQRYARARQSAKDGCFRLRATCALPSWPRSKSPRFDANRIRFDDGPSVTSASVLFRVSAGA